MDPSNMYDVVNSTVSIGEVLKLVDPSLYRNTMKPYSVLCPFHEDTKRSFRVDPIKNLARCFGACQRTFNVTTLYATAQEIPNHEAVREVATLVDVDFTIFEQAYALLDYESAGSPIPTSPEEGELAQAVMYLSLRGIESRTVQEYGVTATLAELILPHVDLTGLHRSTTLRHLDGRDPKYLTEVGPLGDVPFGLQVGLDFGQPLFLAEAAIDTITLSLYGLQSLAVRITSRVETDFLVLNRFPTIFTVFDGDNAGYKAAEYYQLKCASYVRPIELPIGEDVNSLHCKGAFAGFLESALSRYI